MKILLVSPLPPPNGGIATWTADYREYCIQNGVALSIVNSAIVGKRVANFGEAHAFEELKRVIAIINQAKATVKNAKFDVAHVNISCSPKGMIRDNILASMFRRKKIPVVVECHCNVDFQVHTAFARMLLRKLVAKAQKVVVLNEQSKRAIEKICAAKSIIIPNFIGNVEKFERVCDNSIKNILFVGHVVKTKGCHNIIFIAKDFPEITFTLIGCVSAEIKQLKAPSNVLFLGEIAREKVGEYMRNSDLFLFPTHTEGFPMVILEAMAAGLPIITTRVGAIGDILNGNDCFFDVEDEQAMKALITKMMPKAARQALADWEIEELKRNYTTDVVMNTFFRLYEELL